jgi:pilus assembly protein CpaB
VAVFVTTAAEGRAADTSGAETSLLLERVQVVAVGPSTVSSTTTTSDEGTTNTEEIPFAILTLALDQEQAQRVILATSTAQIHFALLGADSKTDEGASSTTTQTLLG